MTGSELAQAIEALRERLKPYEQPLYEDLDPRKLGDDKVIYLDDEPPEHNEHRRLCLSLSDDCWYSLEYVAVERDGIDVLEVWPELLKHDKIARGWQPERLLAALERIANGEKAGQI